MNLKLPGKIYSSIARHVAHRLSHDLDLSLQIDARDRSARFVADNMLDALGVGSRRAIITDACKRADAIDGCFCEFGVYRGESLHLLAKLAPQRIIHGFDSFDGLPQHWRHGFSAQTFKTPVPNFYKKNIKLHVGLFEDTLPKFIKLLDCKIAFAHIDCDIYSSTRTVLNLIIPNLAAGAVLLFDEYFNYPGWEEHEHKALTESVATNALTIQYAAYNQVGEQVIVIVSPRQNNL